jgi:hypothetical protein
VAIFVAFSAAQQVTDFTLPWHPFWSFGFEADSGGTVVSVHPGSPAAQAGLHAGDRIELHGLLLAQRRRIDGLSMATPDSRLTLPILSGATTRDVQLAATPVERTLADNFTNAIETLGILGYCLISAWLVLVRPSVLTWSFMLMALGSQGDASGFAFLPDSVIMPYVALLNAVVMAGAVASVPFAMLFPRASATPAVRKAC